MTEPVRILIADDHAIARPGLRTVLRVQHDMQLVGEATNGQEAVAATAELRPDVVLMDLMMPVLDGVAPGTRFGKQGSAKPRAEPAALQIVAHNKRQLCGSIADRHQLADGQCFELLTAPAHHQQRQAAAVRGEHPFRLTLCRFVRHAPGYVVAQKTRAVAKLQQEGGVHSLPRPVTVTPRIPRHPLLLAISRVIKSSSSPLLQTTVRFSPDNRKRLEPSSAVP